MAVSAEALDIILRLQGVPTYTAGMHQASGANDEFAASSKRAAGMSNEAAAASERQKGAAALVAKSMKATGLIFAAAGVEGIKMAIKFEKQMEMIHTQAGASQQEVDKLKNSVLDLAGVVPQGPEVLAEGLYHLESIGLRGAAAMSALKVAAQGAAVGNADLESTASALGAAWIVNIKGAGSLHNTMGVLNATVGAGNMRMNELVTALGSGILPVAKLAGLSIQDVGAALATLSDSGYSASSAAAQLGTALHFLYAPTTKAKKALESIGLSSKDVIREMSGPNGLHGALELLKSHLSGAGDHAEQMEKLGEIFPGGRGKVILTLITELERLDMKRKQITATGGQFGDAVKRTMEQPAVKIQKAWSALQAELIRLGQAMEGPATAAMVLFAKEAGVALTIIMAMTLHGKLLAPIILGLGTAFVLYKAAVIGAALASWAYDAALTVSIEALYALDVATWGAAAAQWALNVAMDANPIGLIVLGVALAIGAMVLLVTHFRQVTAFLRGPLGTAILLAALAFAPFIAIPLAIAAHWKTVVGVFGTVMGFVKTAWGKLGGLLAYPFEYLWQKASWVFNQIKNAISEVVNAPSHALHGLESAASSVLGGLVPHFAAGGVMPYSGLATINEGASGETVYLPGGSVVQPSAASSLLGPRAHTPNPAPMDSGTPVMIEAYLMMPAGSGRSLFKLVTKEAAIKSARS
jgi:TP901 family phage tail tape measure protein